MRHAKKIKCKLTHTSHRQKMLLLICRCFLVVSHLMFVASSLFENSNLRYVVLDTNAGQ